MVPLGFTQQQLKNVAILRARAVNLNILCTEPIEYRVVMGRTSSLTRVMRSVMRSGGVNDSHEKRESLVHSSRSRVVDENGEIENSLQKRNFNVPPPPPPPMLQPLPIPMQHQMQMQMQPPPLPQQGPQQQQLFSGRGRGMWPPRNQQPNMRGGGYVGGGTEGSIGAGAPRGQPYFRGHRGMPNNRGFYQRGRGQNVPIRYNNYNNSFQRDFYQGPPWNQPPPPYPQQQMQQNSPHHPQQHDQQQQQQQHHQGDSDLQDPNHSGNSEETFTKSKANKRRPMSQSYPSRPWNKEDAERALKEESSHMKGLRNQSLIIRFPDPELSKDIVKAFHPGIDNVHFQVPSGARYCFVQLAEDVNAEIAIKELEQTKFGAGKLVVEKKYNKEEEDLTPEAIDPYTLYIGNLPTNVNVASVKEKFPTASRIDIGFAQRMKFTRYAFIRYNTVDEAIEAYRNTNNLLLDSRSIIVRFRRQRGHVGLPGESKLQKPPKELEKKKKSKSKKEEKISKLKTEQAAKLKVEKVSHYFQ
ncbi:unnamed protein product [Timema podura]|uniref:RRM domain-containing protein n=1 Tax=Timema podura TaxID=61482 RepID=A0ABN7NZL3_TIMPD|nr:unnamed protein product [Timema podura]